MGPPKRAAATLQAYHGVSERGIVYWLNLPALNWLSEAFAQPLREGVAALQASSINKLSSVLTLPIGCSSLSGVAAAGSAATAQDACCMASSNSASAKAGLHALGCNSPHVLKVDVVPGHDMQLMACIEALSTQLP